MTNNGRRRWRKALQNARKHGTGRVFLGPVLKLRSRTMEGFRRHRNSYKCDGKTAAQWYPPLPAKPFDARKLPGATMGARKRWTRTHTATQTTPDGAMNLPAIDAYRNALRIGERLRPCPGCEKCTESPRRQVMAWVRFIGGRAVMRRHNSRVYAEAEYGLTIYRPGPHWNPAAARGVTRARAWLNMRDCLRREKQMGPICDDSGILPAGQRAAGRQKREGSGR